MIKNVAIIGGDLRIIKLACMLEKDGFKVSTFGLEKAYEIKASKCETIAQCVKDANIVIGALPLITNTEYVNMPFSDEKLLIADLLKQIQGKTFIAGSIKPEIYELAKQNNVNIIDIVKREEFAILNAVSTAEGAIQVAISETPKNIHGNNVLVMGFGRIGKILAKMLDGIGAKVSCEARKNTDLAWIKAYGYIPVNLNQLKENLNQYDIIINTIPYMLLDKENLELVKKDALIIDLASNPGGVDRTAVKELGIKFVWALSLPGKVSPVTSAEFMKETVYNIFNEINVTI